MKKVHPVKINCMGSLSWLPLCLVCTNACILKPKTSLIGIHVMIAQRGWCHISWYPTLFIQCATRPCNRGGVRTVFVKRFIPLKYSQCRFRRLWKSWFHPDRRRQGKWDFPVYLVKGLSLWIHLMLQLMSLKESAITACQIVSKQ